MTTPPSETVLWQGRPGAFPYFHRSDLVMLPFMLAITAFFAYMFIIRSTSRPPGAIGLVFTVVIGVATFYNLVGRSVVRWMALRGSEYVVTDRRVVVRTTVLGRTRERGVWLSLLEPPVLRESADGTGSITFGDSGLFDGWGGAGSWNKRDEQPPEFVRIPDARSVRDLIAEARRKVVGGGR
ncbi:MAG: hypothetical protein ABIQ18_06200 [Umezawaea sp.]